MIRLLFTRRIANALCLCGEYAVILWLFSSRKNRPDAWRTFGFLPLLGIAYLYFTPDAQRVIFIEESLSNFFIQLARLLLYWGSVFGYLAVRKDMQRSVAAYEAGFLTAVYLTAQNIRVVLLLLIQSVAAAGDFDRLSSYLAIAAEWILVAVIWHILDLSGLRFVGRARWGLLSITTLLSIYFKWSLMTMISRTPSQGVWGNLLIFAFCAALATLAALLLFELSLQRQEKLRQTQIEQSYLNHEMQNIRRTHQVEEDMRRLYHDMKHHLLALRGMAEEHGQVERYLDELLPQFGHYESLVSTGNPTVDALLSEKMQRAGMENIRFNVYLDLSLLGFMNPADLVSIFGNAVDNAIEAVRVLPAETGRMVYLKSTCVSGLLSLCFSNPFAGQLIPKNGVLSTGKADKAFHGIGLSSIRKTAERYGGAADVRVDNEKGWFYLTVVLPTGQTD